MSAPIAPCDGPKPPKLHVVYAIAGVQQTLVRRWKHSVLVAGVVTAGAPIDTTGYSGRYIVAKPGAPVAAIDLRTGTADLVLTPATGEITINLSRQALAITPGEYHSYLVLTSPAGRDYPLGRERFVVELLGVPL